MRLCLCVHAAAFCLVATLGCGPSAPAAIPRAPRAALEAVAAFDSVRITGVAVAADGRLFVSAPYWSEPHGTSVYEVRPNGERAPYPGYLWNRWGAGLDPAEHFVSVQSVYIDPRNPQTLWVLDAASPLFRGVVPGGAKLVRIDLETNTVVRTYGFDEAVAPEKSYLNDVRVDAAQQHAYLTDSGLGALVVLNLVTGEARRLLGEHPSTHADSGYVPVIGGREWRGPDGRVPPVHADGLALGPNDQFLYYHALTGTRLYRIVTPALTNPEVTAKARARLVQDLGPTVMTDGMIADAEGRIYHSAVEKDAVLRYLPEEEKMETVVEDPRLRWPDSFAIGPDGRLYVTTSQVHLQPQFNGGARRRVEPFYVYKIVPAAP